MCDGFHFIQNLEFEIDKLIDLSNNVWFQFKIKAWNLVKLQIENEVIQQMSK